MIKKSILFLIIVFLLIPLLHAKEITETTQVIKEIKFLYPQSGVYSPESGTYQPYKTGKAHFLIPKIAIVNGSSISHYQLFDNGFLIGNYAAKDLQPNTAIITRDGLHTYTVIGYDLENKSIANDTVIFYAGFRYEDLYRTINQSTAVIVQDTVLESEFAQLSKLNKLNVSFNDYKNAMHFITMNKTITDITAVDKITNETVHHELVTIAFLVNKQVNTFFVYESFPKLSFNQFQNVLFTDSFILVDSDPIVGWQKQDLQLLHPDEDKQVIFSYVIKKQMTNQDIDIISTIPSVDTVYSSSFIYLFIAILVVLLIAGYFGFVYYSQYYKKRKHQVQVYTVEEKIVEHTDVEDKVVEPRQIDGKKE